LIIHYFQLSLRFAIIDRCCFQILLSFSLFRLLFAHFTISFDAGIWRHFHFHFLSLLSLYFDIFHYFIFISYSLYFRCHYFHFLSFRDASLRHFVDIIFAIFISFFHSGAAVTPRFLLSLRFLLLMVKTLREIIDYFFAIIISLLIMPPNIFDEAIDISFTPYIRCAIIIISLLFRCRWCIIIAVSCAIENIMKSRHWQEDTSRKYFDALSYLLMARLSLIIDISTFSLFLLHFIISLLTF